MSLSTDQRSQSAGEAELKELLKVIEQKQRFQALVLNLNELCWDTCMEAPSSRLDDRTSNCMVNCVERFLDTTNFITNRLEYAVTDLDERQKNKSI